MIPVAIAPVLEHIGDVYVVGAVANKDFVADPGIHRTMLGDGAACLESVSLPLLLSASPLWASLVLCCSRYLRLCLEA